MEAATTVRTIPLDRLVLSPANARKTSPSAAEDAELKASLKARGLKLLKVYSETINVIILSALIVRKCTAC